MASDLTNLFASLFTAPVQASLQAEAGYRAIWSKWVENTSKLLEKAGVPADRQEAFIIDQLDLAPIMKFEAAIDVSATVRLVTVKTSSGSAELGLAVGPFQASGAFGFSSENTRESTLSARARYQLSNTNEQTLRDYLEKAQISVKSKDELDAAAAKLKA